jgi:hypothetical protein
MYLNKGATLRYDWPLHLVNWSYIMSTKEPLGGDAYKDCVDAVTTAVQYLRTHPETTADVLATYMRPAEIAAVFAVLPVSEVNTFTGFTTPHKLLAVELAALIDHDRGQELYHFITLVTKLSRPEGRG